MKTNIPLQTSIGFINPAQKVWYAAHVLLAACTSSPAIVIRKAQAAIAAKPAVLAQTAKLARPASTAVISSANTVGYEFGELYLNSPAYPIGTAIPAIPPKPASAAVVAQFAVVAVPAITAISTPAVVAIPGYADAIDIIQSADELKVTIDLPTYKSVGLVGSNKLVIGEITPPLLQSTAWLQEKASNFPSLMSDSYSTLEQFLFHNALLSNHSITDVIRNVNGTFINCKRIVVRLHPSVDFDPLSDDLQLAEVFVDPPRILTLEEQFPHPSPNKTYASESAWLAFVDSTPIGSEEREFVAWVNDNYPSGFTFYTTTGCDAFYNPALHRVDGGSFAMRIGSPYIGSYPDAAWYFYHFVLR